VSAATLLDALIRAGIRLGRDGDDLIADVLPGADLDRYRLSIREHRPELVTLLVLQDEIVAAATAAQSAFDRAAYDELWRRWYALQEQETA
jgi:hypothetical protein